MTNTKYSVDSFDSTKVSTGSLCVIVSSDSEDDIKGAGICAEKSASSYEVTLNGETYVFNEKGLPVSDNAKNFKLKLGGIDRILTDEGSAINSDTKTVVTRGVDTNGNETLASDTTTGDYTVMVDYLNARDQFAVEAMKGILNHIPNPSGLSDSQIAFYCDIAYKWAANMMALAATTRSTTKDSMAVTDTKTVQVDSLDSNTDKLLNNIVVAIGRNNVSSLLKAYLKDGNSTVGLADLISAVKNIKVDNSFPSRQLLAASLSPTSIHDIVAFNEAGAVGYSTINDLSEAVYKNIEDTIDNRIKSWLAASKVTIDDKDYNLTISTPE